MKKMFFCAAATAVVLASCSKENVVDAPALNNNGEETVEAISFQMGSSFEVTTRGTGAVGGNTTETNKWNGQKLNVYMFDQASLDLAYNQTTSANYFENAEVTAPVGVNSGEATYGSAQYYPSTGNFDFFAYHGDDAVTEVPALNDAKDAYTVAVTIDGTQDLMVAKAGLNKQDTTTFEADTRGHDYKRVYSAYSARRGVQPRFTFKHLLSRFVFQAEAAEEGAAGVDGIKITKIEVKAPIKGEMTVAALNKENLGVTFGTEAADSAVLALTNRGAAMTVETLVFGKKVVLGESMLLPAGGKEYVADIYYEQDKDGQTIKDIYTTTIKLSDGSAFVAGTQYKINIKVYDFKKIVLTADLTPWVDGEEVEADAEKE